MDKIKKVIQLGSIENGKWTGGDLLVIFEDESKKPITVSNNDTIGVYDEVLRQNNVGDLDSIKKFIKSDTFDFVDKNNKVDYEKAMKEFNLANEKAISQSNNPNEEETYSQELIEPVELKKHIPRELVAGVLTSAALASAGYTAYQLLSGIENTRDIDDDSNLLDDLSNLGNSISNSALEPSVTTDITPTIDFNSASFDELISSMDENDQRRIVSEKAMQLVETFHEETHKDNNFRLKEDGETYLDLSFEEAMVLTTFANYTEPSDIYQVLGDYNITSTTAKDILESARSKMMIYYMNAVEPSGLADIFQSEADREFFSKYENSIINFNKEHTTEASDGVIRDLYYDYILNGATNNTNVSSMAKLLVVGMVDGGLIQVESASEPHLKFLSFHGNGAEKETKYYVEEYLKLDYDSLSDEEKAKYRTNIIEEGTSLVDLLNDKEVMNEDNSTQEEIDASKSIIELVDRMGLCESLNAEIDEKVQSLDNMSSTKSATADLQITTINNSVSNALRSAGFDELANSVDASITTALSSDLLTEIRQAGMDASEAVENYENKIATVSEQNRPTMDQIVNAADRYTDNLENYAGHSSEIATLFNNRRHIEEMHLAVGENGLIGHDEEGIPIYDETALEGKTQSEIDEFVKENGKVISEKTETVTEEVDYDDLTESEKQEVDKQKDIIESSVAVDNSYAAGGKAANKYANSVSFKFSPSSVVDPANNEKWNLNEMTFANGVAYSYAYGGQVVSANDSQIQNAAEVAAENYLDSFNASDREAIANGLGTSWESARSQLKSSFLNGYIAQMEREIESAKSIGQEMADTSKKAIEKAKELNDQSNSEDSNIENQNNKEDVVKPDKEDDSKDENAKPVAPGNDEYSDATQGEVDVPDTVLPDDSKQESDDSKQENDNTKPAPSEEYDDNVNEHFEEDEVPYTPNSNSSSSSSGDSSSPEDISTPIESEVDVEPAPAEPTQEDSSSVESDSNIEENFEEDEVPYTPSGDSLSSEDTSTLVESEVDVEPAPPAESSPEEEPAIEIDENSMGSVESEQLDDSSTIVKDEVDVEPSLPAESSPEEEPAIETDENSMSSEESVQPDVTSVQDQNETVVEPAPTEPPHEDGPSIEEFNNSVNSEASLQSETTSEETPVEESNTAVEENSNPTDLIKEMVAQEFENILSQEAAASEEEEMSQGGMSR